MLQKEEWKEFSFDHVWFNERTIERTQALVHGLQCRVWLWRDHQWCWSVNAPGVNKAPNITGRASSQDLARGRSMQAAVLQAEINALMNDRS